MIFFNSPKLKKNVRRMELFLLSALVFSPVLAFGQTGPDLVISSGPDISGVLEVGQEIKFSADVLNQGDQNTGNSFIIRFRVDGKKIHDASSEALARGHTRTKVASWTALSGEHTLRVCADASVSDGGNIAESKEANNCLEESFSVKTKSHDGDDDTEGDDTGDGAGFNPPGCSIPSNEGRTVVSFFEDGIIAGGTKDEATSGPVSVSIPAGKYKITLESYDDHFDKTGQEQKKEQFFVRFFSSGLNEIQRTSSISDLPEDKEVLTEIVNNELNLPVKINRLEALHTHWGKTSDKESVMPLCLALDKIEDIPPPLPSPPPALECPLESQSERAIFEFSDRGLLATEASLSEETINALIPAGKYKVTLVSYDNHSDKSEQAQKNEKYFLRLKNPSGQIFADTPSIKDLPEDRDFLTETVAENFNVLQNAAFLSAKHSAFPSSDKESVTPVCAAFDKIIPPPPEPEKADISIQKSVTPSEKQVGGIFTYTLHYKNEGAGVAESVIIADIASPVGKLGSYTMVKNSDHGACKAKTNGITCSLGALLPGASGTIQYSALSLFAGTIHNTAIINTPTPETTLFNNKDNAAVVVKGAALPKASCDSFTANPSSVSSGGGTTLSWTTTNASSVSIDQGLGSVASSGSMAVSGISSSVTYTLSASGSGGSDSCQTTVNVLPPDAPSCTLSLSPASIVSGNSSTLSWTTANVSSASIDNGVGSVSLPAGSKTESPASDTLYTMTALGAGGQTVTCRASLVVTTPAPSCTLEASPSVVSAGGGTTLSWTTTNASSVSIDQGLGSVASSGSMAVSGISSATTYTLNAVGVGGSVFCPATVTVSSGPLADLSITKDVRPDRVQKGGVFTYTLNYKNLGTLDAENTTISDVASPSGILGSYEILSGPASGTCVAEANGITCALGALSAGESGTVTYKAIGVEVGLVNNTAIISTVTAESTLSNNQDSEEVSVFVPADPPCRVNCGGGMNPPRVVMFSKPGENQPFASKSFVYLSQIPYTGLKADFKGILFAAFLSLWSAVIAYLIIKRWKSREFFAGAGSLESFSDRSSLKIGTERAISMTELLEKKESELAERFSIRRQETPVSKVSSTPIPEVFSSGNSKKVSFNGDNLPVSGKAVHSYDSDKIKTGAKAGLEERAREKGVLVSGEALFLAEALLAPFGKEELSALDNIINAALVMYPRDDGFVILDKKRIENIIFSPRCDVVAVFSDWLSRGESRKVFDFLRLLRSRRISVKEFLKKVAYFIDNLYRCRIGESLDDEGFTANLENKCPAWNAADIQKIVSILVNGVDESYESEDASAKLAIVKILEISDKTKAEGKSYYGA